MDKQNVQSFLQSYYMMNALDGKTPKTITVEFLTAVRGFMHDTADDVEDRKTKNLYYRMDELIEGVIWTLNHE